MSGNPLSEVLLSGGAVMANSGDAPPPKKKYDQRRENSFEKIEER